MNQLRDDRQLPAPAAAAALGQSPPSLRDDGLAHAGQIASMSLHLLDEIQRFTIRHRPTDTLRLRIGMHSGSIRASTSSMLQVLSQHGTARHAVRHRVVRCRIRCESGDARRHPCRAVSDVKEPYLARSATLPDRAIFLPMLFNDFSETNYLRICWSDFYDIFTK